MTDTHWACLGIAPHTPPCDAHGTNDRDAEKHTKATQHATSTGHLPRGVEAMVRGFGGGT